MDNDCDGVVDDGLALKTFYKDADRDGYGRNATTVKTCTAPAGYVAAGGDCNDAKNTIFPGAPELCDNLDNDCDGQTDEGFTLTTFYRDYDRDGYGSDRTTILACIVPAGYATKGGDCNDAKSTVYPGAPDIVNGVDDNCNGSIDETTAMVAVQGMAIEEAVISLMVQATPNPSVQYFNLVIQSKSSQPVQIRVLNACGNLVERRNNIASGTALKIGFDYTPGVYILEVVQGAERQIVKLVKQ